MRKRGQRSSRNVLVTVSCRVPIGLSIFFFFFFFYIFPACIFLPRFSAYSERRIKGELLKVNATQYVFCKDTLRGEKAARTRWPSLLKFIAWFCIPDMSLKWKEVLVYKNFSTWSLVTYLIFGSRNVISEKRGVHVTSDVPPPRINCLNWEVGSNLILSLLNKCNK